MNHEAFMREALALAEEAAAHGEIPVGAVIVKDGKIIARGRNDREETRSPLGHAEMRAIEEAAEVLGDWRLTGCTLYVTLEPCPMCAGAILNSRLDAVVYGAADPAAGCMGSRLNLAHLDLGAAPRVKAGVLGEECQALLSRFFQKRREP